MVRFNWLASPIDIRTFGTDGTAVTKVGVIYLTEHPIESTPAVTGRRTENDVRNELVAAGAAVLWAELGYLPEMSPSLSEQISERMVRSILEAHLSGAALIRE